MVDLSKAELRDRLQQLPRAVSGHRKQTDGFPSYLLTGPLCITQLLLRYYDATPQRPPPPRAQRDVAALPFPPWETCHSVIHGASDSSQVLFTPLVAAKAAPDDHYCLAATDVNLPLLSPVQQCMATAPEGCAVAPGESG